MILVTGATGQLGRLVIKSLIEKGVEPSNIIAAARNLDSAQDLSSLGISIRYADYTDPASLKEALEDVEKVLLISSNNVGHRVQEHQAVIQAAAEANVKQLAYTSILKASSTPIKLGAEHIATESDIKASGIPYTILRNGWYSENYLAALPMALQHNAFIGSAGEGKVSSAARADYAEAAAVVLSTEGHLRKTYELAGDNSYTLSDLAAETAKQAGKKLSYHNLPEKEFAKILLDSGLPEGLAYGLADADIGASNGFLESSSSELQYLLGRTTTPIGESIRQALKQL